MNLPGNATHRIFCVQLQSFQIVTEVVLYILLVGIDQVFFFPWWYHP